MLFNGKRDLRSATEGRLDLEVFYTDGFDTEVLVVARCVGPHAGDRIGPGAASASRWAELRHVASLRTASSIMSPRVSMEIFPPTWVSRRRFESGLPADYPNDVCLSHHGDRYRSARIAIPCRADRDNQPTNRAGTDLWPTAEPPHRINQSSSVSPGGFLGGPV